MLRELAASAAWRRREPGTWISPPVDLPTYWAIASGRIAFHLLDDRGAGPVLGFASVGELVETGNGIALAIEALERSVLLSFPTTVLHAFAAREPALSQRLLTLAGPYKRMLERSLSLRLGDATARVADALAWLLEGSGGPGRTTQETIARLAGVTRETANRALRPLEARGAVRRCNGTYRILDTEAIPRRT